MKRFEGKCIGGTRHGERVDADTPVIRLHKRVEAPTTFSKSNEASSEPIEDETYTWGTIHFHDGDLHYWRHSSLQSSYDALKLVL